MTILNLTQHASTDSQREAGVVDLDDTTELKKLLTIVGVPTAPELADRAEKIAGVAVKENASKAMIGGYPALQAFLVAALQRVGIVPVFAHSERVSVEETMPDGTVQKRAVFEHRGFVTIENPIR